MRGGTPPPGRLDQHVRDGGRCFYSSRAGPPGRVTSHCDDADPFVDAWRADYLATFPHRTEHALWLVTRPGGPAREEHD
jgi:hypothetical protein